jgi:RNA polymerase sigma-70 factor (ECF subfamily)
VRTREPAFLTMISEESQRETFARVFAQHHRWLYAYLMSILADFSSTEEVFQEVCVVLWREFGKFDPETDFRRWASVIARHKVYQFRQAKARHGRCLTNEVLELIAEEALERSDLLEERRAALHHCLAELKKSDRELIAACYSETSRNFKQVAEQLRRPANTVYKGLQRIRRVLRECIRRRIAAGA